MVEMKAWRSYAGSVGVSIGGRTAKMQELKRELDEEVRVVDEVAPGQPPGLLAPSKQPFEPGRHHPTGRLPDAAGVEVERRPDAEQHGGGQPAPVVRHPGLLFRAAEAHEHEVRFRSID